MKVQTPVSAFLSSALMRIRPQWNLNRIVDIALSRKAKEVALRHDAALFCYSYYASEAFRPEGNPIRYRFLFQLHPHPRSVRQILLDEMERTPHARMSLMQEHELSLSESAFADFANEAQLANGWMVASSYTAQTLSDQGISRDRIYVVPYGVDGTRFRPRLAVPASEKPFTIIYVGSLIQRKGLSYLLDAVRLLKSKGVRLILCGRSVSDLPLLTHYYDISVDVKLGLTTEELAEELRRSDVFVLPSLAEGFAHVILEAMSCGLPIITTNHTCGVDVLEEGVHGFIVPIRNAEAIAEKLSWGIDHRADLAAMGKAAECQSRTFTWERFRHRALEGYKEMVDSLE